MFRLPTLRLRLPLSSLFSSLSSRPTTTGKLTVASAPACASTSPGALVQSRSLHSSLPHLPAPSITKTVPDTATFLQLIGRNATVHSAKLPTWDSLFTSTSAQLKEAGVEPARLRRYIIWQREKYRLAVLGGRLGARDEVEVKEVKRGKKIDGGERRRKMVRAKRRTEEFREARRKEEQEGKIGEESVAIDGESMMWGEGY